MPDTCWLLLVDPNEPESSRLPVRVYATEELAERDRRQLNEAVEPLRAAAHAFYEAISQHESAEARWWDDAQLKAQRRALFDDILAFQTTHGFRFSPNYHSPRDDAWQPSFELQELPFHS